MSYVTILDFIRDPREADVLWEWDAETNEFVFVCPDCGAIRRIPEEKLVDNEPFRFFHLACCPTRTLAGTRERESVH
jgi:hypothetical protein